jgi:ATP-binding cassette subfamily F protein 3
VKSVRRAFGQKVVLSAVDLVVERSERVALVGPNGAGKSTLMRLLAGVDRPDAGTRVLGHKVVLDYFAQDQAAVLNPARTVYEEMSSASSTTMVPMIRNILGGFLFSGDEVNKRVTVLSGGERNRLAIAKMLLNPSNLLLLDEPTNHLDLDSKEVLLDALADYGGTLVFVSHDRYFVDRLATKVIEVGGGGILVYPGGYEDFLDWKRRRVDGGAELPLPPVVAATTAKQSAASAAAPDPRPAKRGGKADPAGGKACQGPEGPRDPLAPRLRPKNAPPERQVREREARKLKTRIADLERSIGEVAALMTEWEEAQQSLDTVGT